MGSERASTNYRVTGPSFHISGLQASKIEAHGPKLGPNVRRPKDGP